jgi:protein ImuB
MAFASIFVPNFMIQAAVRVEPALRTCVLVLIEGIPSLCTVVAVNQIAAQAGIELGMTKTNAEQFPGVKIHLRSQLQEKSAHAALLDTGWSVSPRLEDTAEDTIILDVSGLNHLFPSAKEIGAHLAQRAAACGLVVNVAIAANVDAALVAARGFAGVTIIPCGEESKYLRDLPVGILSPSAEAAETLRLWGTHTCAALANLPVLPLSERLGQEGVRLHALARGAVSRSLVIVEPVHSFEEEMELEDAVEELDPLSFLLGRMLGQLCTRLAARSLAAAAIRVYFELQPPFERAVGIRAEAFRRRNPPSAYETELQLPVPMRESKMLLKLLRLRLQSNPPAAPIQKIALAAEPARLRAAQGGLFLPCFPDPQKLEVTIARIAGVVGEGNIGSPFLVDTHRPGEFHMQRFWAEAKSTASEEAASPAQTDRKSGPPRPEKLQTHATALESFRAFRPAIPAQLELHADRPVRVILQGERGEVRSASGPWRTSGDWWREDSWACDEWDLEIHFHSFAQFGHLRAGVHPQDGLYRFYYDSLRRGWFARGIYD